MKQAISSWGSPQTSTSKVLSKSVRAYAKRIANDPKQASDFLKRAGIITASGKLSSNYR
jgi:hypothetical protein